MKLYDFFEKDYAPIASMDLKPATWKEYRRLFATVIGPAFGDSGLNSITAQRVANWHIKVRRKTPTQANRALAVLSGILSQATLWDYIPHNPAREVKPTREKARERYLNGQELTRLIDALEAQDQPARALILLCLYTGARPGEILGARWEWVTLDAESIRLLDSKTGPRTIYLSSPARDALQDLYIYRSPAASMGNGYASGRLFPEGLDYRKPWRDVCEAAGLEGVRLYDLRHTFASAALSAGQSLEMVSQLLGHSNPSTTRRYTHLMPEAGNKAAAATADSIEDMMR